MALEWWAASVEKSQQQENLALYMRLLFENKLGLEDFEYSSEVYDASRTCTDSCTRLKECTELSVLR